MKKNILITGATSGIGFSLFKKYIKKNYQLYLIGRNFFNVNKIIINKKDKQKVSKIKFDFKNIFKKFDLRIYQN